MTELSVVIPCRNEALRLPKTLAAIRHTQKAWGINVEVVVADDGSTDGTGACALQTANGLPVRVVSLGYPGGVGLAVQAGVLAARGERILLCDADGPVPFADLEPLWKALDNGADIAAGSRRLQAGSVVERQPWHRVLMGHIWHVIAAYVLPTGVRDTQCGFKLFRRSAAHAIFSRARIVSFAFHVEALALARKLGFLVKECPVRWHDRAGSKVRLLRDPAIMLRDLLGLAWRLRSAKSWSAPANPIHETKRIHHEPRS